jgi:NTP pyrophosphatase (non-canonical NTP hydrolase)
MAKWKHVRRGSVYTEIARGVRIVQVTKEPWVEGMEIFIYKSKERLCASEMYAVDDDPAAVIITRIALQRSYSNPLTEQDVLLIYTGEDAKFCAREQREFLDGRFELIDSTQMDLRQTDKGYALFQRVEFESLREANSARQIAWCADGDSIPDLAFRGNELAGEVGEVCNVVKKLERERHGWRGSRDTVAHLAEELADVVICADLVAMAAGIDLQAAVAAKFNSTSEKVGLPHRLALPKQVSNQHPCTNGCQYSKDVGTWPEHSCGNGCMYDKRVAFVSA